MCMAAARPALAIQHTTCSCATRASWLAANHNCMHEVATDIVAVEFADDIVDTIDFAVIYCVHASLFSFSTCAEEPKH